MKFHKSIALALGSIFILSVSCASAPEASSTVKQSARISTVILHAGGGYDGLRLLNAQETLPYYYDMGYRYFEYDFKLSTDGKLIGTHSFENLTVDQYDLSYDEFTSLRLSNGFTPANEEWLVQTVRAYPDVKIVVDAKMDATGQDGLVLARIEQLESIYDIDLSSNIIPEIFSIEMWEEVKACTTFDHYFFSHYKVYYSVDTILEHFSSEEFLGVAIPTWTDNYIKSNLYKIKEAGKKIFVFTATNDEEVSFAKEVGADGVYVDDPAIIREKEEG